MEITSQRGTSFEVKLTGKAGDGEVKLHSEADSNPSGATELKPFVVGLIPGVTETEPNNKIAEARAGCSAGGDDQRRF